MVDTFGTATIPEEQITELVRENFKLTPKGIIEALDLRRPIYKATAAYGHFGRTGPGFTWETHRPRRCLRKAAGLRRKSPPRGSSRRALDVNWIPPDCELRDLLRRDRSFHISRISEISIKEHVCGDRRTQEGRCERYRAGRCRQAQDRMGQAADARAANHSQAFHQGAAAEGPARFRLPARHQRNRQPDDHAARWRRRRRSVRFESAFHAG